MKTIVFDGKGSIPVADPQKIPTIIKGCKDKKE